jgi:hypothetical protein
LPEEMDHNNLDIIGDFIAPLSEFLDNFSIMTNNNNEKIDSKMTSSTSKNQMKFGKKSKKKNGIISGGLNMKKVPSKMINLEDMDDIDEIDSILYRGKSSSDDIDSDDDEDENSDSEVPSDNNVCL